MSERDGSLVRFMEQRLGMTYTPGAPERNYPEIVSKLAVKVQMNAIEDGTDMSYEDAYQRANENLAYVRVWAVHGRRPE